MEGSFLVKEGRYFKPEEKSKDKTEEKFQSLLKKTIGIANGLLLFSFFLFVSYWLYMHLLEDPYFQLKEIEVKGCQKVKEENIISLIKVDEMPNLFSIKLREISKKIETHPWIEKVNIRKIFPDKMTIQIEERKPIAIIQLEEPYYIDSKGVIFSPVGEKDQYNFPFLTGLSKAMFEKNPVLTKQLIMKALEFLKVIEQERLSPLGGISEVHMNESFGIQYFTQDEGIAVKMGWEQFGEKLKRLNLVGLDLKKRRISAGSIDCSDLKRIVVKKNPYNEN